MLGKVFVEGGLRRKPIAACWAFDPALRYADSRCRLLTVGILGLQRNGWLVHHIPPG